jgi:cytochrome c oxidase subunit 2
VVVELASQDVIHSLFIPAFRVKQDAVPGLSTDVWFQASQAGTYDLFCSEFCGAGHSHMTGQVVAMSPEDYAAWLAAQPQADDAVAEGGALFRALGCSGCHENGTAQAPSLTGVAGHPVALSNSTTVVADDQYLRDSILLPQKQIVAGYQPAMPSFAGYLSENDMGDLIAYLHALAGTGKPS